LFTALSLCLFAGIQNAGAQNAPAAGTGAATATSPSDASKPADNKAADDKTVNMETVTVTGIVGSLNRTIDAKRSETAIVDAVSAEDVGKFPDTNLADSLQHITGVQITRNVSTYGGNANGEGSSVSVRGLPTDFTLATLNGVSTTSSVPGSRSFDFNLLSPDFVRTLKVYKSSRADLDEGGIAANIDMETVTPFGIGKQRAVLTAKLQGSPGESSNRNYPDITGLYSNVFADGTFGVTVGFDWNKRFFLGQTTDQNPFYPANINGKTYHVYTETGYGNAIDKIDTKTGYLALQWKPMDSTTATLTGLYAKRDNYNALVDFGVVPIEPYYGDYTGPGVDLTADANGVLTRLSTPAVAYTYFTQTATDQSKLKNLRLNFDTQIGNWQFNETAQYSGTHDQEHLLRFLMINSAVPAGTASNPIPETPNNPSAVYGGYAFNPGDPLQSYILNPALDLTNPANWVNQQLKDQSFGGSDTLRSLQEDVTRSFDDSVIESIKFGAKIYQRTRVNYSTQANYPYAPYPYQTAVQYPSWVGNVFDRYGGSSAGAMPRNWFFINPNLWFNQYFGSEANFLKAPNTINQSNPANNWEQIERGRDAYAMANFKFDGDIPITGNVGVRYVHTAEEMRYFGVDVYQVKFPTGCVFGTAGCETLVYPPLSTVDRRGSTHEFLPSFNAVADLRDDMNLRLSVSKTLSLPTLGSMVPVDNLNGYQSTDSRGNIGLHPFSSLNYDLSWEWYFRPSSILSVALYDKQIHGFIQQGFFSIVVDNHTFKGSQPVNGSNGYVRGVEADYKQTLDFLPSFWSGFGYELNATYAKGQQDAAPQYNVLAGPFPGLTKLTYNATVFYEKYGLSALLTLNHRGRYFIGQDWSGDDNIYGDARTVVDGQVGYQITDYATVSLDVKNLFDKPITLSQQLLGVNTRYPGSYVNNGRQVMLGVTLKY
jgi:TonB-dependent receptor